MKREKINTHRRTRVINTNERGHRVVCGWRSCLFVCVLVFILHIPGPAEALYFDTVEIHSVDTRGVVIHWVTDQPSNGTIYYGLMISEASRTFLELTMSKSHYTSLFGLLEGEKYDFRISARSDSGELATSNWREFTTLGIPHPKVKRVEFSDYTIEGATVSWWSNIPVKGVFECGYDTSYGFRQEEKKFSDIHQVKVQRFRPKRKIKFRIRATDARGLVSAEYLGEFMTMENNIALGAPVTGTFWRNTDPGFIKDTPPILGRVTDGKLDYFRGMATSGDPDGDTQWVQVDLGKLQFVDQILTYWRQLTYPKKFTLSGSMNGQRWENLGDTHDPSLGRAMQSQTGDPLWEYTAPVGNQVFRYIRLEVPQGAPYIRRFEGFRYLQLFELKVYPPEIPEKRR